MRASTPGSSITDAIFKTVRAALPPDLVGRKPRRSAILKPV
jgi:hypothetical protein